MNTEYQRLTIAAKVLERHAPAEIAQWFADGVSAFTQGESKTLCAGLRLRARGHSSISFELAREERDHYLRTTFLELPETESTRSRVLRLGGHIRGFVSVNWTGSRKEEKAPPARYTTIQRALFFAFKSGIGVPSGLTALTAIVTAEMSSFERLRNDVKSSKVNNPEAA